MANMYVSVTTNITDFYDDVQNSDIFNRSDNSTIKKTTVHFNNDELQSKPTFEIMFGDTTFETAFVYVCLVITFLGITGNIAAMAIILYKPKFHTPTFAAIGYLALADFFAGIILSLVRTSNIPFSPKIEECFVTICLDELVNWQDGRIHRLKSLSGVRTTLFSRLERIAHLGLV
uniref:G-protein coupled receptors family 1 profile domain-containing protein n=1 Tax=Magallana gigas TaxID=29159 RepID=A0A8W8LUN0_MAGGI